MIGIRAKLSTQGTTIVIKLQILYNNTCGMKAISCLDLEKAIDKTAHSFVLETISNLNLGTNFYNYVKCFLSILKARDLSSEEVELGACGTPRFSHFHIPVRHGYEWTGQGAGQNRLH